MQKIRISNMNYACAKYLPTSKGMDKLCKLIELSVEVLKVLNVEKVGKRIENKTIVIP